MVVVGVVVVVLVLVLVLVLVVVLSVVVVVEVFNVVVKVLVEGFLVVVVAGMTKCRPVEVRKVCTLDTSVLVPLSVR